MIPRAWLMAWRDFNESHLTPPSDRTRAFECLLAGLVALASIIVAGVLLWWLT